MLYALKLRLTQRSDNSLIKAVLVADSMADEFFLRLPVQSILFPSNLFRGAEPAANGGITRYFSSDYKPSRMSLQTLAVDVLIGEGSLVSMAYDVQSNIFENHDVMEAWIAGYLSESENAAATGQDSAQMSSADQAQMDEHFGGNGVEILYGYTQDNMYSGHLGYGSYRRNRRNGDGGEVYNRPRVSDPVCRVGVELEMFGRSQEAYREIINTRTNWYMCETDSSLHGDYPVEVKTIPINLSSALKKEFWEPAMDWFKARAKSKSNNSSGLHLHFGTEVFGADDQTRRKNIGKLVFFYCGFVKEDSRLREINTVINGRSACYGNVSHTEVLNSSRTPNSKLYLDYIKDCFSVVDETAAERFESLAVQEMFTANSSRWDINTRHLNDYKTVEFRLPKGIISSTRLAALIGYYYTMITYTASHHIWEYNKDGFIAALRQNPNVAWYLFQGDEEA